MWFLLLVPVLALGVYAWYAAMPPERSPAPEKRETKAEMSPSLAQAPKPVGEASPKTEPPAPAAESPSDVVEEEAPAPEEAKPAPVTEQGEEAGEEATAQEVQIPEPLVVEGPAVEIPAAEEESARLVLSGIVQARTWVKITIDQQEPKEYIFQPGSRPQWKAKNGFTILIGNAAGIDLEFNGKKLENLGNTGQVISLNLPDGYRGTTLED